VHQIAFANGATNGTYFNTKAVFELSGAHDDTLHRITDNGKGIAKKKLTDR
jgi:hypothetical protein